LNFVVDDERLERLKESNPFQGLATSRKKGAAGLKEIEAGQQLQQQLLAALETLRSEPLSKNREAFIKRLKKAFKAADLSIPAPLMKAILSVLGERDETADICTDSKGNPEADSDLRDYENVPLKEEVKVYFEREVIPHVPDAWIDESKTKKGYEIPFTRHFYQYTPLRPLPDIETEIKGLEDEIQGMLKEVLS
jgi:type I restriction enzyme M protein